MKEALTTPDQSSPLAPYSTAIKSGDYIFLSGQVACDPVSGEVMLGNVETQTRLIMENIRTLLDAHGLRMDDIVKCNVYLTDYPRDFEGMNAAYQSYFSPPYPARFAAGVKDLYPGCCVEIDAIVEVPRPVVSTGFQGHFSA
jgi:2-iminobutanoate/2-iminopropanoate deaminase